MTHHENKNICDISRDLMLQKLAGSISPASQDFIDEHLKTCEDCRQALDTMEAEHSQRDRLFQDTVVKAGKKQKKQKRKLTIVTIIIVFLLLNVWTGVRTGVPALTLYSKGLSNSDSSGYDVRMSLGYTVYDFHLDQANYYVVKPWFMQPEEPETISEELYDDLMIQLVAWNSGDYKPYEADYLEVQSFAQCHIYKIERFGDELKIYGWLYESGYAKYDVWLYTTNGSSMPVVLTATIESEDKATLTDVWYPEDGGNYDQSIKAAVPKEVYREIFSSDNGSDKARAKEEKAASAAMGAPISDNHLQLDSETGALEIIKVIDGIDENGQYFFDTKTIHKTNLKKANPAGE